MKKHITAIVAAIVLFAAAAVQLETPKNIQIAQAEPITPVITKVDNYVESKEPPVALKAIPTPSIVIPSPTIVATPVAVATPKHVSKYCEDYRSIVAQYNWDVNTMMYAMHKESSCNPHAVGDNRTINGVYAPSCGLLQIRTLAGRPTCEELKDPNVNIEWAYKIFLSQGYKAWTVLR